MKVRDLGKVILDFELNQIPKAIFFIFLMVFGLLFGVFCWVIKTYKALWALILIGCAITFFASLEKDCVGYPCLGLIDLEYQGYAIDEDGLYIIISLLVGLVAAFMIDKKLPKAETETS